MGTGLVFGLQEALDQLGTFAGPMVFTAVFLTTGREDLASYQLGYRMMFLAYILVMAAVFIAYRRISGYDLAREGETITRDSDRLTPTFWLYCLFTFLATFGPGGLLHHRLPPQGSRGVQRCDHHLAVLLRDDRGCGGGADNRPGL